MNLFKFEATAGFSGDFVTGLFAATPEQVKAAIGKEIYTDDAEVVLEERHVSLVSADPYVVQAVIAGFPEAFVEENGSVTLMGVNPSVIGEDND